MKWRGPESAPFPLPKSEPPFPPAPFTCCETLGKLFNFSQYPSL